MSSSRHVSDDVVQAPSKPPVKSNFLQTCNLLSRYIKQKGSLKDLNLEIGGKVESLDAIVKPGSSLSASTSNSNSNSQEKSTKETSSEQQPFIDLSSHVSGPNPSSIITIEDSSNKTSTSKEGAAKTTASTEAKPSQLTIFYSGRVLVFDDYPADKARELVSIAKKSSSQMSYGILPNTTHSRKQHVGVLSNTSCKEKSIPTMNSLAAREGLPPRPQPAGGKDKAKASTVGSPEAAATKAVPEQASPAQSEANGSDLPIARRSSLHRFLEKRKDRAAARGPYQQHHQNQDNGGTNDYSSSSSAKGNEHLDLNL